jgi:hypothetical protein
MTSPQIAQMTNEEFDHYVMQILACELGPGGFSRYLMLHRSGSGDYTAERHQWQADITLEQIWREMEAQGLTQK